MSSSLRSGLRVALNRPRVLSLVAAVVLVEVVLRVVLGFVYPVASVIFPPVVALSVLGSALPTVRSLTTGHPSTSEWRLVTRLRERGRSLVAAAVVCHAVALALGTVFFLLVDTPLRYAYYFVDGGTLPWKLVYVAPLLGVLLGTLLAWGPLAPVVVRVAEGEALSTALETATAVAIGQPRRTATVLGLHFLAAVVVLGTALTCFVFVDQSRPDVVSDVVVGSVLAFLAGVLTLGVLYPIHTALANTTPERARVPVGRVVLAVVVVTAAVAGAGAVRVTESRPAPDLEPLRDDPSGMYATAVDNTGRTGYDMRYVERLRGKTRLVRRAFDHRDREFLAASNSSGSNTTIYGDAGVTTYYVFGFSSAFALGDRQVGRNTATALPFYWRVRSEGPPTGAFALPRAGTGQWTVVDRTGDTVTLELTDDDAVYRALYGTPPEYLDITYETAWIRMRVDTDRGVVVGGTARLDVTRQGNPLDLRRQYDVETGDDVDVERPEKLNPRRPAEWVWKLFAY